MFKVKRDEERMAIPAVRRNRSDAEAKVINMMEALEVGGSITIKIDDLTGGYGVLKNIVYRYPRTKSELRFTMRKLDDSKYRIWRSQ
jgi:hypothetical protein